MDAHDFAGFLGQLSRLTAAQTEMVRGLLADPSQAVAVREVLESRSPEVTRTCPHCAGTRIGTWGQANGLARLRCRECKRTFNALTGTPLARLRKKDRWLTQARALEEAASLRQAAEACGVALTTAFRWRHRFLRAGTQTVRTTLEGIVEADETFVRRSYKGARLWRRRAPDAPPAPRAKARRRGAPTGRRGTPLDEQVPVLVMRDRQGHTHTTVLPDLTAASIARDLLPVLGPEVILCSDTAKAYAVTARRAGLRHEPVNLAAGERVRDGVFHIQNVNAYDSRLKDWMRRFRSVATRYLPSYLAWHRMSERLATTSTPQSVLINCCL